jgi:hypothetical protein
VNRIIPIAALVVIFSVMPLMTQQPSAPKPDPAPTISDAHRAQFFKAQLRFNQAQQEFQQSQQALQLAVSVMQADCGGGVGGTDKYQPQMDPQGDPVCQLKPASPKTAEKPAEKK